MEEKHIKRERNKVGALTTAVGIVLNTLLCGAKIAVGAIFGSVAVMGDGFNNLTDAGSSIVGLVGFKMADKPADKDHPFGHARYEYLTGLIVAFVVLFLGLQLGRDSIEKLIEKGVTEFSVITVGVLGASIAVKAFMFVFYRIIAKKINSLTLKAAAADSLSDVISTGAVLACTLVAHFVKIELDGYIGLLVALFIIINGAKLAKEAMSPLLGEKPDPELVKSIKDKILSYEGVSGIHDLIVHNYGPNRYFVSVHVETDASLDSITIHEIADGVEKEVSEMGINITVHSDPVINDDRTSGAKELVKSCLAEIDPDLRMHDFRMVWGEGHINLIFDMEMPFDYKLSGEETVKLLKEKVKEKDDKYELVVTAEKGFVGE